MPSCQAYGCSNTSGRTPGKLSYFRFPNSVHEKSQVERSLHNIGTGQTINTFKFGRDKVVCSDHFHRDCLEIDLRAQHLGYTPKRTNLKPGAVPTIFKHKVYSLINMNGETGTERVTSCKRRQKKDHNDVSTRSFVLFFSMFKISRVKKMKTNYQMGTSIFIWELIKQCLIAYWWKKMRLSSLCKLIEIAE